MDERRRQRRQQRILEASQSRLSKITGTEYQKAPVIPESSLARRNSTDDPSEDLGAPQPTHPFSQSVFGETPGFLKDMPKTSTAERQETTLKYWNLAHLTLMSLLGFYTVYRERADGGREQFASLLTQSAYYVPSVSFFWHFVFLEIGLQSARMLYQQGQVTDSPTLSLFASQLPYPFGSVVNVLLRYRLIGSCLVQDVSVLVFILGFSIALSTLV
ncbi:hypothetical protein BY458DRAFT_528156 [Sporodiniella umbellata]|nr:hypothetical protein BY458DRAFT_528156 [Sporodiniella umbellata]